MEEVYYIAIKKDGEWIVNMLELGILSCRYTEPMLYYNVHVPTPYLAYKFMEELKEKNPNNEYKIFKSVDMKFDNSIEFDLEPFIEWWNIKKK